MRSYEVIVDEAEGRINYHLNKISGPLSYQGFQETGPWDIKHKTTILS